MQVSTSQLYPLVHDLTEAEYAGGSSSTCGCCHDTVLGRYSLNEIVNPSTTSRRPLPMVEVVSLGSQSSSPHTAAASSSPSSPMTTKKSCSSASSSDDGRHKRAKSWWTIRPSDLLPQHSCHRRWHSSPSEYPISDAMEDSTSMSTEMEDRGGADRFQFDDIYVLTRQVRRLLRSSCGVWGVCLCFILCVLEFYY